MPIADSNVKFLYGLESNYPQSNPGINTIYVCTDTQNIYIGDTKYTRNISINTPDITVNSALTSLTLSESTSGDYEFTLETKEFASAEILSSIIQMQSNWSSVKLRCYRIGRLITLQFMGIYTGSITDNVPIVDVLSDYSPASPSNVHVVQPIIFNGYISTGTVGSTFPKGQSLVTTQVFIPVNESIFYVKVPTDTSLNSKTLVFNATWVTQFLENET